MTRELTDQTERLYDQMADDWVRSEPTILSDFIARPFVLEECLPRVRGGRCLDLGCGEGYFTRMLASAQAAAVTGVDLSSEMIRRAHEEEKWRPLKITYLVGSVTDELPVERHSFDVVTAINVFNYLTIDATQSVFRRVCDYLAPRGCLAFLIPHPFILRYWKKSKLFSFDGGPTGDYYADRDRKTEGRIMKIDGSYCDVLYSHKTFEDYFTLLRSAGLNVVESVREFGVPREVAEKLPQFDPGAENCPFFAFFKVTRAS
jgi:SAM-dependent methyltransferase